ncbi:MAG: flagellin [Burkholderiaceae bacterium]
MAVINTNTKALFSQNALKVSGKLQAKSMEQLSTGKRINTAGDDAAGLAISTRMTQQIRALNQAVRNAGDAISLIQTAEGATGEITNMMQRMRELAIQAINDTNSNPDRSYLDLEFQQLKQEVQRIAEMTEWNGFKVLDGTAGERVGEVPVYKNTSINLSGQVLIDPTTVRTIDGAGGGEIQSLSFEGRTTAGQGSLNIMGKSYNITADADLDASTFATQVAQTLREHPDFNETSGRQIIDDENGTLNFVFAASDGDVDDITLSAGSSLGTTASVTDVPRQAIVTTNEFFTGNAAFSRSGTLALSIPAIGTTVTANFTTPDQEIISLTGVLNREEGTVTFDRGAGNNRQVFSGDLASDSLVYTFRTSDGNAVDLTDPENRAVTLNIDVSGTIPALRSGDLKINGIDVGASYARDDQLSPRNNAAGSAIAKAAAINRVAAATGITMGESQTLTFAGVPREGVIKVGGVDVQITAADDTSVKVAAKIAAALKSSHLYEVNTGRVVSYAQGGSVINIDFPPKDGDVGTLEILPGTTGMVGIADVTQEYTTASQGTGVYAKVNQNVVVGRAMDSSSVVSGVVRINGYTSANITTVLNNTRETRENVVEAINAISHRTGVKAIDTGVDSRGVTLVAEDGRNIEVSFETDYNVDLFGSRIGLREGVQSSTISLESKITTPVVLSASAMGDITRAGMIEGNFTKNQSVYNTVAREIVGPAQSQVMAVNISGPASGDQFSVIINGAEFKVTAGALDTAQTIRNALVTSINNDQSLGVTATKGRTAEEILLTATNPGVSYTLTTSTTGAGEIEGVTVLPNRPADFKALAADDVVINGVKIRPSTNGDDEKSSIQSYSSNRASSAIAIAAAINSHSPETGVRAMANGAFTRGLNTDTTLIPSNSAVSIYSLYVNDIAVEVEFRRDESPLDRRAKVVQAINARVGQHGVTASDNGRGVSLETDGRNLSVWFDSNVPGLSAAHFGLDKGGSVAQVSRITVGGSVAAANTATVEVNGITITSAAAGATTTVALATALEAAINAKITSGDLRNLSVVRTGDVIELTSTIAGSPFDLRGASVSASGPSLALATVRDNSMGENDITAIRGTEEVPASASRMAKTVYGTVRLISDAALLPKLPSPVGAPPSDRLALLKSDAQPFEVRVGERGFTESGSFVALGFQEGRFGGRSSEAMDPPKVGRLAFQVGSSAYQLITIDLADFGKNGSITNEITGDVDQNVEQRTVRINTRDGATNVLRMLDDAMDKINGTRAQMGAVMNRLQYAMDNLSNVSMNQEASRSQILDADYAKSSTEMAKSQIMQQAATAVLAQANMSQQTVLQLLQG